MEYEDDFLTRQNNFFNNKKQELFEKMNKLRKKECP